MKRQEMKRQKMMKRRRKTMMSLMLERFEEPDSEDEDEEDDDDEDEEDEDSDAEAKKASMLCSDILCLKRPTCRKVVKKHPHYLAESSCSMCHLISPVFPLKAGARWWYC